MTNKRDTYQTVTDRIIASLESCGPFERPWIGVGLTMPVNAVSGHKYRGANVVTLWASAMQAGYTRNEWATFKQWADRGAKVRKGETGTPVVWFSMIDKTDRQAAENGDDENGNRFPCARHSWAFNIAQIEGYEPEPLPLTNQVDPIDSAEQLVQASGAKIHHGGNRAFYRPSTDEIHMPNREQFTGTSTSSATEAYYSTLLHELTHWTGPRLHRDFGKRFGDAAYSAEELVAELGAAFLCAELGVTAHTREDHASYIAHWLQLLKDDRRAIFTAASKAADASDYLLAKIHAQQEAA